MRGRTRYTGVLGGRTRYTGGLRGAKPPYLGEEQIDRGNNDKLQNYLYPHSAYSLQASLFKV